jgi:Flp pilus assembly protein TadB
MPDSIVTLGAITAGATVGVALFALADRPDGIDAGRWLAHRRHAQAPPQMERTRRWLQPLNRLRVRARLVAAFARAGWNGSPERLIAVALVLCCALTALGIAFGGPVFGAFGFAIGAGASAMVLRSAIAARRRHLAAELVPLLELFTLELSGGGSALAALGSVTGKVQGELSADMRRLLIAAQVAGSVPFETRLMQYSEQQGIPRLASLATILGASREYGTGVLHGVRALATDLRHAQRRELIAHSRRALNHVLIPAAIGVLLPFLAIVMFPAVTALQQHLH